MFLQIDFLQISFCKILMFFCLRETRARLKFKSQAISQNLILLQNELYFDGNIIKYSLVQNQFIKCKIDTMIQQNNIYSSHQLIKYIFFNYALLNSKILICILSSIPYYFLTLIPLKLLLSQEYNPFTIIAMNHCIFPMLDELFSLEQRNPTQFQRKQLENDDFKFRLALYINIIFDWMAFYQIMRNDVSEIPLYHPTIIGSIINRSHRYASQFLIAHQTMHKPGLFHKIIANIQMLKMHYMHFTYHHLYIHHRFVATPEDDASADKGQNVYKFVYNSIINSWISVYREEQKIGKSFFKNYAILSIFESLIFDFLLVYFAGWKMFLIHLATVLGSVIYLEDINYVEHYGLRRKKLSNGEYEKTTILHSWNAPHRFSNYVMFKLQRHSDHHQNSSKPYQTQISYQQSPNLPHGYFIMMVMAWFPKTWSRIMDPLVDAYNRLDHSKGQKIDPAIKKKAEKQTRVFMIEIALISLLFLVFSFFVVEKQMARKMSCYIFK